MKRNMLFYPLAVILFLCVVSLSYAFSRPDFVSHNFLASNGTVTVSFKADLNNLNVLRYSNDGGKSWSDDTKGDCLEGDYIGEKPPSNVHMVCDSDGSNCHEVSDEGIRARANGGAFINSVKYIPETKQFVAVGYYFSDRNDIQYTGARFCSSEDGIKWKKNNMVETHPFQAKLRSLNDIVYGKGYYVAVGQKDQEALVEVADADHVKLGAPNWSEFRVTEESEISHPINSIIFPDVGANFVAAANQSTIYNLIPPTSESKFWSVVTGKDADTDQNINANYNFNQVLYFNDKGFQPINMFVVIGDHSVIWYSKVSDDGVGLKWHYVNLGNGEHAGFNQIINANNVFVIAADQSTIWRSGDGVEWVSVNNSDDVEAKFDQITWLGNCFKVTGYDNNGKEHIRYGTRDAMSWSQDSTQCK